ncbi:MAG: hypothetical protein OQK82_01755 [Candidatus Pacearchaeota archaeon]|nr:hypothetical protein [Candidatus Pacearchaeota archaeon]
MKRGILLLALLFTINFTLAIESIDFDNFCQNIDQNELSNIEVPSYIPYTDEIFNFYVKEEILNGSIILENKTVTSANCQENQNPTYNIYIKNLETIKDFADSNNTLELYNQKIKNKEIEIKGATLTKKIKMAFINLLIKIASWFR